MNTSNPRYWFRAKRYGSGWGLPLAWQGWIFLAPPRTVVADVASAQPGVEVRFLAVSPVKLVLLSVCTLGIYHHYWFYKHWFLIRERSERTSFPGRAPFS